MLILSIDTSCDDTSVAVLKEESGVLSNVVNSQVKLHAPYSGVVPELASREHLRNLIPVLDQALKEAGVSLKEISAVAVTIGPGLMGSLLVGLYVAKAICLAQDIKLIPVNHLEGHILSVLLEEEKPNFPYLALTVSGGHTSLYLVNSPLSYSNLGNTLDDAAGEAFDKVAKLFRLGYPGGRIIEDLARQGRPGRVKFPKAYLGKDSLDFSFSGIKTAVASYYKRWQSDTGLQKEISLQDMAFAFQEAVCEMLCRNLFLAQEKTKVTQLAVAGGVACNNFLRQMVKQKADTLGVKCYFPRPSFCTDNAAMIALAGYFRLQANQIGDMAIDAVAKFPIKTLEVK